MGETSVLLSTLNTYPFESGGVSTWCDILCHGLPQVDFILYIIKSRPKSNSKYDIPYNVQKLIYVTTNGARKSGSWVMKNLPFFQDEPGKNRPTE